MDHDSSRRVVVNITLSLDGRTSGPGGDYGMGWIVPHAVTDAARDGMLRLTGATMVLLGRKNYDGFGGHWPTVAEDENAESRDRAFAQWLNRVEKVVFSSTLTSSSWSNSRVANRDPAATVGIARAGQRRHVVLASQRIIRALLDADEVGRLSINVAPELVGGGTRLFEAGGCTTTAVGQAPDLVGASP